MSDSLMQHFKYKHLPEKLQEISKLVAELAEELDERLPDHAAEKSVGLRKLLEAKDCFVRAQIQAMNKEE